MSKETVVFSLTISDFESVLGRELTEDEVCTIKNKFAIESWIDYVDAFLAVRGFYD